MIVTKYSTSKIETEIPIKEEGTSLLSKVQAGSACLLNLPKGLIGFFNSTQCQFEMLEDGPIHVLTVLPDKDIQFYLVNPYLVRKDYVLDISEDDFVILGKPAESDIAVFSILTMKDNADVTCNLLGPVLINTVKNIAHQCVNNIENWGTKHRISDGVKVEV